MYFKSAKHIVDYIIEAKLDNGEVKYYDFEKWLLGDVNPMFYKFRDLEKFKKVKVWEGILIWGKDEMDFLPEHIKRFEIKNYKKPYDTNIPKAHNIMASEGFVPWKKVKQESRKKSETKK